MKSVHEELPNKDFERPDGIVEKSVCILSGKLASAGCTAYTEVFTEDNAPTETCEGHSGATICTESKLLATPGCPSTMATYLPEKEQNASWVTQNVVSTVPTEYCTLHGGNGSTSYVTAEDQVKFQAATDAAAMGLMGVDADAYINQKLEEWRKSQTGASTTSNIEDTHKHTYTTTKETPATCTIAGTRTKTCSCGDVKTETIPAKGHNYAGGATCTVCGEPNKNYKPDTGNESKEPAEPQNITAQPTNQNQTNTNV